MAILTPDPQPGVHLTAVAIQITSSEPDVTIRYGTNGTADTLYTGPISISTSTRLTVQGVDGDGVTVTPVYEWDYTQRRRLEQMCHLAWSAAAPVDAVCGIQWAGIAPQDQAVSVVMPAIATMDQHQEILWPATRRVDLAQEIAMPVSIRSDQSVQLTMDRTIGIDRQVVLRQDSAKAVDRFVHLAWPMAVPVDVTGHLVWAKTLATDTPCHLVSMRTRRQDQAVAISLGKSRKSDQTIDIMMVGGRPPEGQAPDPQWHRMATGCVVPWVVLPVAIRYSQGVNMVRVADGAPVSIDAAMLRTDLSSWWWEMEAVPTSAAAMDLVRPNALGAGPVEVEITINGYRWRCLVRGYSRSRSVDSSGYRISGRSLSHRLALPPGASGAYLNTSAKTAVSQVLDGTGWAFDWSLFDGAWPIDRLDFADETRLALISRIAAAAGGVVQSDPADRRLYLQPRYRVMPWHWADARPDATITAGIEQFSATWVEAPGYNRVIVSGRNQGSVDPVVRDGTAGDRAGPEIVDPLVTVTGVNRARGMAFLAANAMDREEVDIETPLPGPGQEPGLMRPGTLVEVMESPDRVWRGQVMRLSIRADKTPRTTQSITLERHYG